MRTELENYLLELWNDGYHSGEGGSDEFGMSWARIVIVLPTDGQKHDYLVTQNSDGVVTVQNYDSATWQSLEVAYSDWLDHQDYLDPFDRALGYDIDKVYPDSNKGVM